MGNLSYPSQEPSIHGQHPKLNFGLNIKSFQIDDKK